jgi:hypothetical protein
MNEALAVSRNDRLPSLSWLLQLGGDGAHLTCGQGVETTGSSFFEGAWAGPFQPGAFHDCANVFGSGAICSDGRWILVPPSHTLEAIYILQVPEGGWSASNSLAFLAAAAGLDLQFRFPRTVTDFIAIVQGIKDTPRRIRNAHPALYTLHYHNALLSRQLEMKPKRQRKPFQQYQEYRDYLANVLSTTAENAAHAGRRARYQLLATVSSGYDSPACAAIARAAGCTEGVTFLQSREGVDDDGSAIGACLGLRMSGIQHPVFTTGPANDRSVAAEFFATGMQGEDITYAALGGMLRHRALVTGVLGDKLWNLHGSPDANLKRADVAGTSLTEFRLREDFVHLPLPFVGACHHPSIHAISNSAEMRSYVVGGTYDRPIPRRIAEEAGVARNLFGQRKKAVTIHVFRNRALMPDVIRTAAKTRLRRQGITAKIRYLFASAWYFAGMHIFTRRPCSRIARHMPAVLARIYSRVRYETITLIWPQPFGILEHMDPLTGYATEAALDIVAERYKDFRNQDPGRRP